MLNVRRTARRQRAQPYTLPAPVGGLNGRDALANMPPQDAFVLDNWFPTNTKMMTRKGHTSHATGLGAPVETLAVYEGGSSSKMLGFAGGSVYDVTSSGAVGAAIASGRASNEVATTMFSNLGNQFLIGCSGADATFQYDGTTWTTTAITSAEPGFDADALRCPCTFKGRLLFAQTGMLGFFYLAVGNISGAASYFDLSQIAKNGGYVSSIATFSADTGSGPDDYVVFMTSKGEYVVYAGTDPSTAANFRLVGRYYAPPPIGRKGWFNFRGDLFIITKSGVLPFAVIRASGSTDENRTSLSAKLGRAFTDVAELYSGTQGWCATVYDRSNMLVVNMPASGNTAGDYYQLVMNTDTNSWCRFTGWNALCFTILNDRLYFGKYDGTVMLADDGYDDNGTEISVDCRQAYNYFDDQRGAMFADKQFHFASFVLGAEDTVPVSAELSVNFENTVPSYAATFTTVSGSLWDVATWDVDEWAGGIETRAVTVPFGELGYAASAWLRMTVSDFQVEWYATRIIFERAAGVGQLV